VNEFSAHERILGVDPGLQATGYAVIETGRTSAGVILAGVVRTDREAPLEKRLEQIHQGLSQVIRETSPRVAVVEELYSHYNHPRTAILMGHARGVIYFTARQHGLEVKSYSATRIKKFLTGNGRASKAQIQKTIQVSLKLDAPPEPPDVADALAVALCHCNVLGHKAGQEYRTGINNRIKK